MKNGDLKKWLAQANCQAQWSYTVPLVAAEGPHGGELALEWIDSRKEGPALAGWATLSGLVALTDDDQLDIALIHDQPNDARYSMRCRSRRTTSGRPRRAARSARSARPCAAESRLWEESDARSAASRRAWPLRASPPPIAPSACITVSPGPSSRSHFSAVRMPSRGGSDR